MDKGHGLRKAIEANNRRDTSSSYLSDDTKYWLKVAGGLGLTGLLTLSVAGVGMKAAEESSIEFLEIGMQYSSDIAEYSVEYSEEISQGLSYSFEAIDSFLG
ncbi:MAG: hypothetical protein ACLFTA_03470 [Candidatus Nanohaloarchaea archaeon]